MYCKLLLSRVICKDSKLTPVCTQLVYLYIKVRKPTEFKTYFIRPFEEDDCTPYRSIF